MITIKNKESIRKMAQAGKELVAILHDITPLIKAGISTLALDNFIEKCIRERGLVSRTKGYMGYRHASCISLNDEVVHGIPSAQRILQEGDLVKIDVCASWRGYCADMARSFYVGTMPPHIERLVNTAQEALNKAIEQVRPGKTLGDISAAIQAEIEKEGLGIVRDFAGHGIGKHMHEEPEVLNYGHAGKGPTLRPGMAFAIEPMVTLGAHDVFVADDGWTVKTVDRMIAAHVEDTVVVTENEPKVLTRADSAVIEL
jgi:methionyl aminopeptidase